MNIEIFSAKLKKLGFDAMFDKITQGETLLWKHGSFPELMVKFEGKQLIIMDSSEFFLSANGGLEYSEPISAFYWRDVIRFMYTEVEKHKKLLREPKIS